LVCANIEFNRPVHTKQKIIQYFIVGISCSYDSFSGMMVLINSVGVIPVSCLKAL